MFLRLSLFTLALVLFPAFALAQKADESPAPVKVVRAFPNLKITRPTVFTTARDGTDRIYVVTQQGKISVFPRSVLSFWPLPCGSLAAPPSPNAI